MLASMGFVSSAAIALPFETESTENLKPVLLPAQPPLEHNGGLSIRTWVRSEMTGGLYSSVETAVAPKTMGPPPHYHKELDELMYVVEGTASVLVGGEVIEVKAGGWHLRPRLIEHTFWNASDKSLRFIDMYFNQPFEQYLERIFFELTDKNGFPEGSEAKIKELNALNQKFGVVFSATAFKEYDEMKKRYGLK
ncbi:MAG: cupin [Bacteroidetes bacterium B1(2017)]|nr:MAG: cupin [Bacteroidetes bacterium B1(2017)]